MIRERVLRILLNNPSGIQSIYRIAKEAGGSYPWVYELLGTLEHYGVLKGTSVTDFRKLMALWQKWRITPDKREYMIRKPLDVLRKTGLSFALTTYQAENLVQNYLFPSRFDFYIKLDEFKQWHKILSREGLVGRGNVRVLMTDEHVFYKSFVLKGLNIVSVPQLIIDLFTEGGVCTEAGSMLIDKELRRSKSASLPGL